MKDKKFVGNISNEKSNIRCHSPVLSRATGKQTKQTKKQKKKKGYSTFAFALLKTLCIKN